MSMFSYLLCKVQNWKYMLFLLQTWSVLIDLLGITWTEFIHDSILPPFPSFWALCSKLASYCKSADVFLAACLTFCSAELMLASIFSSSLLLPKTSGPSEGENQFKLPPGTGTPYELVHFSKLTVFHCLLRETLLCLTESIQSTRMMDSLSVTGFQRFSLGRTESDLYGLGYAYSSLTAHAWSLF